MRTKQIENCGKVFRMIEVEQYFPGIQAVPMPLPLSLQNYDKMDGVSLYLSMDNEMNGRR